MLKKCSKKIKLTVSVVKMESEVQTQTQKKTPKPFSIESLIGSDRKSPEIDIENNVEQHSEDEDSDRLEELNRMRYYFNAPFLQQNGVSFPFLLGYNEPWISRMLGNSVPGPPVENKEDQKRESPVSVGSEIDSDGGEDNTQGLLSINLSNQIIYPLQGISLIFSAYNYYLLLGIRPKFSA